MILSFLYARPWARGKGSQTFQIQILAPLPRSYVTSLVNYNTLDDYLSMDVFSALKLSLKVRLPVLSSLSFPLTFSFCEIIVFQVPLKEILALFIPHAFLISCIQLYIRPYYVSLHSEFFLLLLFKKKKQTHCFIFTPTASALVQPLILSHVDHCCLCL